MKYPVLFFVLMIFLSSCREKENKTPLATTDRSTYLSDANRNLLQSFCNHIADSADAGIAVADLHSKKLIVISNERYIAASSFKPASTFKIITAINSIVENVIVPSTFRCTGKVIIRDETIHCWDKKGHGVQSLTEAIKNSCNCFFAKLGSMSSSNDLRKVADHFGYGKVTSFHLNGEKDGLLRAQIPDEGKVLFALGHSRYCEVTGLQLLQLMCTLATKGEFINQTNMYDWTKLAPVYRGMEGVVLNGTGQSALVSEYPAAGKTGTLEGDVSWDAHAWFCGYAPYDNPECAIVVFCNQGTGSTTAAPIAGIVLKKIAELRKYK